MRICLNCLLHVHPKEIRIPIVYLLTYVYHWQRKSVIHSSTGSEEKEVFGAASIPVAILPSGQDRKTIAL